MCISMVAAFVAQGRKPYPPPQGTALLRKRPCLPRLISSALRSLGWKWSWGWGWLPRFFHAKAVEATSVGDVNAHSASSEFDEAQNGIVRCALLRTQNWVVPKHHLMRLSFLSLWFLCFWRLLQEVLETLPGKNLKRASRGYFYFQRVVV